MRFASLALAASIAAAQTTPATSPSTAPAPSAQTVPQTEAEKAQAELTRARRTLSDWPNLARYAAENAKVAPAAPDEERVVFMGDSITDAWGRQYPRFFPGKPYINRGIGGQTTAQMLLRFRPDVIAHKPKAVLILAGTNDIAGNTGPYSFEATKNNLMSMVDLARANNIKVILATVMPVDDYHRNQTTRRPPEKIIELNNWIKSYAGQNKLTLLDYHSAMVDEKGWMKQELTTDGLHPHEKGYALIEPLAQKAIAETLGSAKP
ncbi:MAG TPA: SGNH/GDSL hydrolase family protein [Bryobacteraceae bacterium]|nr:SGNH/GDSL hydrolase family protein [Bryobacteraceae bacterium]